MTLPAPSAGQARTQTPVALLLVIAALAWTWRLLAEPAPWPETSGALLAVSILVVHAVLAVAALLSMSRWIAIAITVSVAAELALALALPIDVAWWAGVGAITASCLAAWRPRSVAAWTSVSRTDRVPPLATSLALTLLSTPFAVGAVSIEGMTAGGWALAGAATALAWAYMRAHVWALWCVRSVYVAVVVWAMFGQPWLSAIGLGAVGLTSVGLAWTNAALIATNPLSPERVKPVAILPEVVPADLLESAGFDSKGRPRHRKPPGQPRARRPQTGPAEGDRGGS